MQTCQTEVVNKFSGRVCNPGENIMPTCSTMKSSVSLYSNYWENCDYDKGYEAYYRFNKEQCYEGDFFRDGLHGQGTYEWNDVAIYEGCFYSNAKEGYAGLSFPDGSFFEGLFIRNAPFGPGILTYPNGRQDAGFWMGRKLVRLSRAVDFIIPRLAPTSAAKIKLLQFRRLIPLNEPNWDLGIDVLKKCGYPFEHFYSPYSSLIYDPRSTFFDSQAFEKTYFVNIKEVLKEFKDGQKTWESGTVPRKEEKELRKHVPCLPFSMDNQDICDEESTQAEQEMGILGYLTKFGTIDGLDEEEQESAIVSENTSVAGEEEETGKIESRPTTIVSWNRSELCTEMLKQIFRYRAFEEKLTFDLAQLMLGVRTAFRRTGVREKQCLQFLKMCSLGPAHIVKDMLCSHEISEELMDARGNSSLMFAAAADQHEIIDILLDYGVDVNTFNDENLTPLNLCLLRRLAHSKGIANWETAFLPKEVDLSPYDSEQSRALEAQVLEAQVSIASLDRIFGDGMSLSDSRSRILDSRYLTPFPSPTLLKETIDTHPMHKSRYSDESRDMSDLSQITILNLNKSPGSHILIHSAQDDDPRTHYAEKRSSSMSAAREAKEASQPLRSNEETPRLNIQMVPRSNKRDEFVRSILKSNKDKYLFGFTFDKEPHVADSKEVEVSGKRNKRGSKQLKETKMDEEEEEESKEVEELVDFELTKKIVEIDKTIQKLLRRGADPNISEVPKPAIHLGIYTNDLSTVYDLLLYGANPNAQLYANEGLLTPLHVVVLQPASRVLVDICEMLLKFDADQDKETHPEFSICEEEKDFLDPEQGRTPLQLLCMRPDLEYADHENNLIRIALLLAAASKMINFYKGHTCLSLAMLFGNIKLLGALLQSGLFDPNEVLGKDRGTALHVLVSTELQKKTTFENSISMCDLLIDAGANPLKKFKHPKHLRGTCVDYGYREIEAEKEARKASATVKKESKTKEKPGKEKSAVRDYLQDHEKVVEYLGNIALDMSGKKKANSRKRKRGSSSQESITDGLKKERDVSGQADEYAEGESGKGRKEQEDKGKAKQKGKDLQDILSGKEGKKSDKDLEKGKKGDRDLEKGKKAGKGLEKGDDGDTGLEKGKKGGKGLGKETKSDSELRKRKKGGDDNGDKANEKSGRDKKGKGAGGDDKKGERDLKEVKKKKDEGEKAGKLGKKNKPGFEGDKEKASPKGKEKGTGDDHRRGARRLESDQKNYQSTLKEKESNLLKLSKGSFKNSSTKQLGARSETFPEKLRQNLLKLYGNCNIDINEFLVPYVVLRDGDLYYRFQGKTPRGNKEQYSLI